MVLHSHPPKDTVPPQARMAGALHRYRPLQKGQTAGCDAKACLVTSIPESCWWHGHLHTLDPVPRPQATSPADMPHLSVVQNSYVTDQNNPPACLQLKAVGVAGGGRRPWRSCPRLGNVDVGVWEPSSDGDGTKQGPALVGGCAFSCCGRSGGAARSPGGTAGRCAAAGSTAGSSRHGRRGGRPSGPVKRPAFAAGLLGCPGVRQWARKPFPPLHARPDALLLSCFHFSSAGTPGVYHHPALSLF